MNPKLEPLNPRAGGGESARSEGDGLEEAEAMVEGLTSQVPQGIFTSQVFHQSGIFH